MKPFKPPVKFKSLASSQTQAGARTFPPSPDLTPAEMRQITAPDSTEVANRSRVIAGASAGESGFTCARCLRWFPQGTHHACQRYTDVIRNDETKAPESTVMTTEEIQLLREAGQI